MNSYNLLITGSWFFLIFLILVALGLALWTYSRTIPPISEKKRVLLITLRSIALALMLFALFEPIYSVVRSFMEEPKIAVLLDNSVSAGTKDASFSRDEQYREALAAAELNSIDNRAFLFDATSKQIGDISFDSLDFSGQTTDISRAIRGLNSLPEADNIRGVVLFTDGAFNSGNNPVFDAERLGKPIYVVGIGDTIEPNDIAVLSIITNEVAYIDNPVPINVNFKAVGFDGETIKLTISDNNQKIAEREIIIQKGREKYTESFEYTPSTEGIRKITASIAPFEREITDKNNAISEFIRVITNKRNIAVFAGAPSPDVTFIKQAFELEQGVELKEYIQKQGAEFYNMPTAAELNAAEMIVMVGFPIQSTPKNVIDMILRELERGKPLMFVAGQQVDYNKVKDFQNYLPFVVVSSRPQEFLVLPDVKANALSSALMRINGNDEDLKLWNNLPPIYRTETFVRVKPESDVLSTMKINNAPLNDPLIVSRHFQNSKSVAVLGYGLYRWRLLGYAAELAKGRTDAIDIFGTFINNSFRWLSVGEQDRLVRVRSSRQTYNQTEVVELLGEVYDQSYTPITQANLLVKLSGGDQDEQREVMLNSMGNGRYYATVAGLGSGDYSFNAEATYSGRKIGTDNGRFSIGEISLEYQNLKMNISLLQAIAERTGGKFYFPSQSGDLADDIKQHRGFVARDAISKSEIAVWNLAILLGIAILLLSIEWFIRKRSGMI
jgi:hypothetical protein